MFSKILQDLIIDIRAEKNLTLSSTRTRSSHSLKYKQFPLPMTIISIASFRKQFVSRIHSEAPYSVPFQQELSKVSF